jgi:hypothetical protein
MERTEWRGQEGQDRIDRTGGAKQDGQDRIYMAWRTGLTGRIGELERMLNRT